MKKSTLTLCVIMLISIAFKSGNIYAQKEFRPITTKDGIAIEYRFKPSKCLQKNSPLVLQLKIQNTTDEFKEVKFVVDYYLNTLTYATSQEQTFCVKPKKKIIGKVKKSAFDKAELSNEEIRSDKFTVDVSQLGVNAVENCKK